MKKFIAVISDRKGENLRFVADVSGMSDPSDIADLTRYGRTPTFRLATEEKEAHLFDVQSDAEAVAREAIRQRMGKPFSGGLYNFSIRAVDVEPSIVKKPGRRPRREPPEPYAYTGLGTDIEAFTTPLEKTCPTFDWKGDGDELYAVLAAIIDSIDYTNQACSPAEPVGGVLDRVLIDRALEKLSRWRNQCYKFAATANPEAFGKP